MPISGTPHMAIATTAPRAMATRALVSVSRFVTANQAWAGYAAGGTVM